MGVGFGTVGSSVLLQAIAAAADSAKHRAVAIFISVLFLFRLWD